MSPPDGGSTVTNTDMEIGRLQGAIAATQDQQARDRQQNNARFDRIEDKLSGQDTKLDKLLAAQEVAKSIRADSERRQDARARRLAWWASAGSGLIAVLAGEVLRWVLFRHGGAR